MQNLRGSLNSSLCQLTFRTAKIYGINYKQGKLTNKDWVFIAKFIFKRDLTNMFLKGTKFSNI